MSEFNSYGLEPKKHFKLLEHEGYVVEFGATTQMKMSVRGSSAEDSEAQAKRSGT
jgi:hypothetical protein